MSPRESSIPGYVWPLLLAAVGLLILTPTGAGTLLVKIPLAAGLLVTAAFLWVLWRRRQGSVPWFEIGVVYVGVVAVYLTYPLLGFLALGQTYTPLNDARLFMMQPRAEDVGRIGWLYVCHLTGFAVVYLLVRGRLPIQVPPIRRPRLSVFIAVVVVYVSIEAFGVFLGLFYDTSGDTYLKTYLAARRLPLIFSQLFNHLNGIKYVLSVMLMAALFTRYPASRRVIAGWLLLVGAITIAKLGSRTELVLLGLAAALIYERLVRPIQPRLLLAAGTAGLLAFVGFGALRNARLGGGLAGLNPFAYANEFENLFTNSLHLNQILPSIGELPLAFYFADFAALVPQQFVPFIKIDRADWYVNRFFPDYALVGGGLAFGTISEAVLTGGWASALAAGCALGFCFARIHRLYFQHSDSFWIFVMYVWVTTLSYQSFRNSTFALLVLFAYRFVPAVLLVSLVATVLRPFLTSRPRQPASAPGALGA